METLTPEIALSWRALCEYLKSKGDEGEEFLEQILPEPVVYAEYLLRYNFFLWFGMYLCCSLCQSPSLLLPQRQAWLGMN